MTSKILKVISLDVMTRRQTRAIQVALGTVPETVHGVIPKRVSDGVCGLIFTAIRGARRGWVSRAFRSTTGRATCRPVHDMTCAAIAAAT